MCHVPIWEYLRQGHKVFPSNLCFGHPIKDFIQIPPGRYKPLNIWRETLLAREEAFRNRHMREAGWLSEHTKRLIPLAVLLAVNHLHTLFQHQYNRRLLGLRYLHLPLHYLERNLIHNQIVYFSMIPPLVRIKLVMIQVSSKAMAGTPFNTIPAPPDPDTTAKTVTQPKVVNTEVNGVPRRR